MNHGINTIIYPVRDLARAKMFFASLLGIEPYLDQPYYVGMRLGGQDIGLDPNGHANGMTGPVAYHHVTDIREAIEALVGAGAELQQASPDVGGGKLIATLTDGDGNVIGLIQEP